MLAQHDPVDVGKPEVEHDEIGVDAVDEVEPGRSGGGDVHLMTAGLERGGEHRLLGPVVLDHDDGGLVNAHAAQ